LVVAPTLTAVDTHAGLLIAFVYPSLPEATTVAILAEASVSMIILYADSAASHADM
jgi:hypothetical protein